MSAHEMQYNTHAYRERKRVNRKDKRTNKCLLQMYKGKAVVNATFCAATTTEARSCSHGTRLNGQMVLACVYASLSGCLVLQRERTMQQKWENGCDGEWEKCI